MSFNRFHQTPIDEYPTFVICLEDSSRLSAAEGYQDSIYKDEYREYVYGRYGFSVGEFGRMLVGHPRKYEHIDSMCMFWAWILTLQTSD